MKSVRFTQLAVLLVFAVTLLTSPAHALLKAVGAVDPVQTVPKYYLDTNNLALTLCTDQNGFCILPPPFDPALPPMTTITTTGPVDDTNFPDESFYYSAEAILPIDGDDARLTFVVEAAFLGGVMPDGGIVFLRTDLVKMQGLTPNSTYRVTHPYGTFNFTTDNVGDTTGGGGVAVRQEDTAGGPALWLPAGMKAGTITGIGPFLTRKTGGLIVDPISGHTYIGDAATPVEVVGSPTGNNFFRVERILTNGVPVSGVSWQTDFFVLMGRVYTDPIPSELSVSATYARDAVDGQVDIFATAQPGAVLNLSGTGITATDLTAENPATGKYFLNIPLSTSDLPSNLVVSNSLDLQSHPPHPITLVDEVNITEANYNQSTNVLTIKATSRDKLAPFPTLTAANFTAPGNSFDSNGVFTKTLTTIPPQTVTVTSSKGGSATAPVSVGVPDPLVITTTEILPDYAIGSLYNQLISASGGVPPYTWSSSVSGTLPPGINFFASAGRLFGTPPAFGTYSFSLQVSDSLGAVTIKPFTLTSSTPPNPVAVADTASTTAGSTVVINVVANDTSPVSSINPATLSVSAATGGSAVANPDGTVSYTAPAVAGTYTFTYTVKDNGTPAMLSNETAVDITVTVPPPAAPTLVSPSGTTSNSSPAFIWNAVQTATDYDIFKDVNGVQTLTSYPASACTNGTCSVTQTPALVDGSNVYWIVRAKNSGGISAWSAPLTFIFTASVTPTIPVLIGPAGTVANTTPVYTWSASAGATDYDLFKDVNGVQTLTSYQSTVCVDGTCSVTQNPALVDGTNVYWIVRAKNIAGVSAWSTSKSFIVTSAVVPATPSLVAPFDTASTNPTYSWTDIIDATSYDMFIDVNGVQSIVSYTSVGNCDGTTCSVTPAPQLPTGANVYWIVRAKNIAGISGWSTPFTFIAN